MSLLNPNKLRSEVEAREARKIKSFEHILEMCYNKILTTNKQTDSCCCIFTCPSVVFGLPLFNMYDCIRYIIVKLVEKGFEVHLAVPNNIFISWKSDSNAEYSRKLYQLDTPSRIPNALEYCKSNHSGYGSQSQNKTGSIDKSEKNDRTERKLFLGKSQQKDKNYRPIEEFNINSNDIYFIDSNSKKESYSMNDIDLFRNKLDELIL
jgi:hypothetical protein